MRRRLIIVAVGAGLAALLAGCTSTPAKDAGSSSSASPAAGTSAGGGGSTSSGATSTAETLTPVLASVSTSPVPVTGTDGKVFLAYELYLTNITSSPATITSVSALDASGGAVLQERSGDDLLSHFLIAGSTPSATPPTSLVIPAGGLAVVWVDPTVEDGKTVPKELQHTVKLTFAEAPNPLIPAAVSETGVAQTAASTVPAPVIASPLDGKGWLDGNGCCNALTPHRASITNPINGSYRSAERFAIDWVQLNGDGQIYTGDRTQLSSYAYYGVPIHAVTDGEIVAVSDDLPDEPPGENPPVGALQVDQYGGNHIVEKFTQNGQTYYAFYAHLKPGTASATVKVGDKVKVGQKLAELGNSGNTDGPHLHFHVMDSPNPLASTGLPFRFSSMTVVGQATGTDAVVDAASNGTPLAMASGGVTGTQKDVMPLYLDVLDLTAGK